jgi:(p)ppGpp synthase/HD superfamily hydrolase
MTEPSRFQRALLLASELHATQTRKGTRIPYVAHLLGVAATVMEHGGGEDEAIAALLHDAVEDQGGDATAERIRAAFGERIRELVLALSDWPSSRPKGEVVPRAATSTVEPKPPWRARKEQYLAHLAATDDAVRLVSMADKLYNAQSLARDLRAHGAATLDRFTGGREGTLWYYEALVATYAKTSSRGTALFAELAEVVVELRSLAAS